MATARDPLNYAARIESVELVRAASEIVGFKIGKREWGGARNVSGIRNATFTFSRRLDSRTIFASDIRYGILAKAGAWTGSDRTAVARCRRLMRNAGVPLREIAQIAVLSEFGAVAERLSDAEVRQCEPQLLRKLVRATRAVDEVPVWTSHLQLGLTAKGEVGALELHWPHLSPSVLKEAALLGAMVKRGFKPPQLAGARPESLAAGVIHSPAIGFFMDQVAVIRAIYVGDDPTIGRKPMLYLDRHCEPVALPRDIAVALQQPREPRPPAKGQPAATR